LATPTKIKVMLLCPHHEGIHVGGTGTGAGTGEWSFSRPGRCTSRN